MTVFDVVVYVAAGADYYPSTPGPLRFVLATFAGRRKASALAERTQTQDGRRGVSYAVEESPEEDLQHRYRPHGLTLRS